MTHFKYSLDKSSRKFECPGCHQKRFVKYVITETGSYLEGSFGRCDREGECGYFVPPETDMDNHVFPPITFQVQKERAYIPSEIQSRLLGNYDRNSFIQNLLKSVPFPFSSEKIEEVIKHYLIGTIPSGEMCGAVTFPFIDQNDRICAVQLKRFDHTNKTIDTNWIHRILAHHYDRIGKPTPKWLKNYMNNESYVTCFFGMHLLKRFPKNPIAVVEAPKTAIYATLYYGLPSSSSDFIWLASFNKSSLTVRRIKQLEGRKVVLFPDLSSNGQTYTDWSKVAYQVKANHFDMNVLVSDLLESSATTDERGQALDLADYLIKMDWRDFEKV